MAITLKRYREIRRADNLDDQHNSAAITGANASSTTQEDYQTYVLSRLRQVMFGDGAENWFDDFMALEIPSLREGQLALLLSDAPSNVGTTYSLTKDVNNLVTQETWVRVLPATTLKTVDYTYVLNRVSTEVTRVYALDGFTILAQTTSTYSYADGFVSGVVTTRDI